MAEPVLAPAYNLFRRKLIPDLCCAAPEDRPAPAFLDGATWEYAGTLRHGDAPLPGFDHAAAALGSQLNGFHLFQVVGRRPPLARPLWLGINRGYGRSGLAALNSAADPGTGRGADGPQLGL